jgi:hypothetical protein
MHWCRPGCQVLAGSSINVGVCTQLATWAAPGHAGKSNLDSMHVWGTPPVNWGLMLHEQVFPALFCSSCPSMSHL